MYYYDYINLSFGSAMTFEQLRVLNAIITEGTFHGAALHLNKSQPALSHMIKKLENEIGVKLLSRESYRPQLTQAGQVFYRKSLSVLEEMKELNETAQHLSGGQEAEIHLVLSATCELSPLLSIVNEIRQDYPNTHIRISIEMMGGPLEKLMKGAADLIIASIDEAPRDEIFALPYKQVNIIPVCHADYPPALKKGSKKSSYMKNYPQIIVADSSSGAFEQSRDLVPGNQRWTVSDFASKKEIIKSQMGWGGLPEHLINEELETGVLVPLELEEFPVRCSQLMIMRKRSISLGPVAHSLWDRILSPSPFK